jgi:hypothetical protein
MSMPSVVKRGYEPPGMRRRSSEAAQRQVGRWDTARVCVMAYPDAEVLDWASAVLDTEVTVLRGLRHGGSAPRSAG